MPPRRRRPAASRARAAAACLAAAAHLNPNRRAEEAELLAELVDEESLIREMKGRRHVREEHERRRRDADLRGVENPHMRTLRAHGWIRGRHLGDESIQYRRRDARA